MASFLCIFQDISHMHIYFYTDGRVLTLYPARFPVCQYITRLQHDLVSGCNNLPCYLNSCAAFCPDAAL